MINLRADFDQMGLASDFTLVLEDLSIGSFVTVECIDIKGAGRRFFVVVGIAGAYKGRVVLDADQDAVTLMTQRMNFDEPVLDLSEQCLYMAELTNMLGGKLITFLNNSHPGMELRLTPPAVFTGLDLLVTSPKMKARRLCFAMGDTKFNLEISVEGV